MIFQAAEPVADRKAHSLTLRKSNAMEVEFQVGPMGKVGLMFKFAGGKSHNLTNMEPVKTRIRLKDVSAITEAK